MQWNHLKFFLYIYKFANILKTCFFYFIIVYGVIPHIDAGKKRVI